MPYKDPKKAKEYRRKYYQKHKERIKKRASEWNRKNREKRTEDKKRWREENEGKTREYYITAKNKDGFKEKRAKYYKKYREKIKGEAENKVGKICKLCGGNKRLMFHEKYYKPHKTGPSAIFLARKEPERFMRLCSRCHRLIHTLYDTFDMTYEEFAKLLSSKHRGDTKVNRGNKG